MKTGTVKKATGNPNPHDFIIEDEEGNKYFAHLGDIEENEKFLYAHPNTTTYLQEGDSVQFDPVEYQEHKGTRAIHVKKVV